jgi:hypothetical protein
MRLWGVIVLVVVVIALTGPAWSETVFGDANSKQELKRHYTKFRFQVVNTATRHKVGSYGTWVQCVIPLRKSKPMPFAYTFGEETADRAKEKALAAFDSSQCRRDKPDIVNYHAKNPNHKQ